MAIIKCRVRETSAAGTRKGTPNPMFEFISSLIKVMHGFCSFVFFSIGMSVSPKGLKSNQVGINNWVSYFLVFS